MFTHLHLFLQFLSHLNQVYFHVGISLRIKTCALENLFRFIVRVYVGSNYHRDFSSNFRTFIFRFKLFNNSFYSVSIMSFMEFSKFHSNIYFMLFTKNILNHAECLKQTIGRFIDASSFTLAINF